ncbi:MAG: FliG C-terminal domain-containing protein [Elusimicrobiota bacterium]
MFFLITLIIFLIPTTIFSQSTDINTTILLTEQKAKYERERGDYIQKNILDKILGQDRATIIIDADMGIETITRFAEQKEKKVESKKKATETKWLMPGIPMPKSVTQPEEAPSAEANVKGASAEQTGIETKIVVKRQTAIVVHDDKIADDLLKVVREAIIATLRLDTKRGDIIEFKKAKFTTTFNKKILESLTGLFNPQYIIIAIITVILLAFLFGPLAGFLKNYVQTLRDRGGTEITVDSKMEGAGAGGLGAGAGGVGGMGMLSEAEIAAKKEEKEKEEEEKYKPFEYINDENYKKLIYLLSKEPPEVAAMVISYLKPEYVREILINLPPEKQASLALNLATVRQTTQRRVMDIDADIKQKIDFLVGGLDHVMKIINDVDRETQMNILEYFKNEKPDFYEQIRQEIILFEDVVNFPDVAMQLIIRELKIDNLSVALKDAPQEVVNKFLANMSTGAQSLVKEEMQYGKAVSPEQVQEERKKIVAVIKRLETEGKIAIREKAKQKIYLGIEEIESIGGDLAGTAEGASEYFNQGSALLEEGRYDDAIPYFEYCLQLEPSNPQFWQYLANAQYSAGRFDEALASFEKALELEPENEELKAFVAQVRASV